MTGKKIIRVAVNPKADDIIGNIAEQNDMTKIGVASRIYEWFGTMPDSTQRIILGLYGSLAPDISRMILESQAKLCEDEPQENCSASQAGAPPRVIDQGKTGARKAGAG